MPYSTFFNLPEEKRQKILECAIEEFAQNDYESASISQIVAKSGIAKGSLYQYFADKRDLHGYLLELASQKKAELLASTRSNDTGKTIFDTLYGLFTEMARFEILYPRLAKIRYRAIYGKSPLPEALIHQARQSTAQYFLELVEQGKQRGEIRPDVSSSAAAFLFSAALTQLGNTLTVKGGGESYQLPEGGSDLLWMSEVSETYRQVIDILHFGLGKA